MGIEEKLCIVIKKKKRGNFNIVLNKGPFYGLDENKNKHKILISLNAKVSPPIIVRSVQTLNNKYVVSKQMINVTRFPSFDYFASQQDLHEIEEYECKNKWFYQIDSSEYKEYDAITSKEIELSINNGKSFLILNKGAFAVPKKKNLFKIKFNHHSIPSEATQIECINLKQESESQIKYEAINPLANDESLNANNSTNDEVMDMIFSTKHWMRPISIKYWQKQCDLSPHELPKCVICFDEFTKESFIEYWIMRKLQKKECDEVISSKQIAIQLSQCRGQHFFHSECIARYLAPKRKCAYCSVSYGVEIGSQPNGKMSVRIMPKEDVESSKYGTENKGKGSIQIVHKFPSGVQGAKHPNPGKNYGARTEFIYLPASEDGMECLGLIRVGWKRKLLYTIGHSVTLNASDRIIFNGIHFKTSRYGGVENYGWPDKTQ